MTEHKNAAAMAIEMTEAVAELRHDYAIRARHGDGHAVFHLAVADWIEGHAHDLASSGNLSSCDSPGDVEAAANIAATWRAS